MREALRLFFEVDKSRSREIDHMNQRIAEGLAQLDREKQSQATKRAA